MDRPSLRMALIPMPLTIPAKRHTPTGPPCFRWLALRSENSTVLGMSSLRLTVQTDRARFLVKTEPNGESCPPPLPSSFLRWSMISTARRRERTASMAACVSADDSAAPPPGIDERIDDHEINAVLVAEATNRPCGLSDWRSLVPVVQAASLFGPSVEFA